MKSKLLALLVTLMLLTNIPFPSIPPARATEWHVYPGQSIQEAINAASPSDTIIVHDGIYDEQVVVNKSLTLQGVGDTTIIRPSGTGKLTSFYTLGTQEGAFWNGHKLASIISVQDVGTAGVTVENLKVDGVNVDGLPAGANYVVGISYGETAGTIDDVTVVNMNSVPIETRTYGMWLDAVSTSVSIEVKNSLISYYNKNGIIARGAVLTANIHDNTIIGPGDGGEQVPNGIVFAFEAGGTARYNDISALHYTLGTWLGFGIMGYVAKDGLIIEYNVLHDIDAGIGPSSYSLIRYNEIYDCYQGIELEWYEECAYNNIEGNQIHDNTYGIHLLGPGSPYYTGPGDEPGPGNKASYNNIFSNTEGVRNWDTTQIFEAENNWWGYASGPTHSSNPSGTGDRISDYVDYSPWLGDVFETTPRTYYVNPTGTIQEAVDEASPGDTIIVHAGTYDEQVVINKSLTLQGMGDTTVVKPSSDAKLTTVLDGHFGGGTKQIAGILVANVATGSSVTVKNLKVDGDSVTAKPTGADYVAGIFYRETGGTIDSVTVTGITIGTTGTAVRGYGIYLSAIANAVSVEIKGSTITSYDKNGIDAHGNKLTVNIHHNTITGRGPLPSGDEVQNGILIMDGATGTVNTNTISNMAYIPETWWSAGIMFYDSSGSAIGNTVTDCQIGVIFQDGNGWAQDNTVTGGTVGLLGLWAQYTKGGTWTASFVNNTVSGARDSPGYDNGAIGAQCWNEGALITLTIDNNQIIGDGSTSADGIYIGDIPEYGPAGSITATITNNVISGWQHGIRLVSSVTDATITGNTIKNNLGTDSGIHIEPAVTVTNIHVNYNNIFGNNATGVYGISNNGIGTLDARYNWWGHPTGPYNPELNPSGKGVRISSYVDFEPWLLEPYPPPIPVETLLYIDPAEIEFWTPSYNQVFKVELKIAEVTDLTCYEFKLYWNTTLLDFDYAFIIEIWPLQIKWEDINESLGRYWLGVTARGEEKFTGNATLVELYFKIKYDPIYPNNVYSLLNLNETILGDASEPTPQPIVHMVHDGEYWLYSTKPKMKVEPSMSTSKKLGKVFSVNITVQDVVDLYNFEFWLYYNTTLLDIYSPYVQLGPLMSGATVYISEWNDDLGYVHFAARLTSPAPPVNGSGTIAIVTFRVTAASVWPDPDLECTLSLENTKLKTIGGTEVPHDEVDGLYRYTPVIGDLSSDGTVDLDDLYIISLAYGSKPGDTNWNRIADLNRDNIVNVLDLRTAARHYGEDC